jgi:hypothetical protein
MVLYQVFWELFEEVNIRFLNVVVALVDIEHAVLLLESDDISIEHLLAVDVKHLLQSAASTKDNQSITTTLALLFVRLPVTALTLSRAVTGIAGVAMKIGTRLAGNAYL